MIVVVAVSEKNVPITDTFNPVALTGRHAIFAKTPTQTEVRHEIEIVGVYSTLEKANLGRQAYAATHPGRKYVQKVAPLDGIEAEPEPAKCVECGFPTPDGLSYHDSCRTERYKRLREADPDLLAEIAKASR